MADLGSDAGQGIKKYSSPRGDGNEDILPFKRIKPKLRNIAPREGTEIWKRLASGQRGQD